MKIYPQEILDLYIKYNLKPCFYNTRPINGKCCGFGVKLVDYYGGIDKVKSIIAPPELCSLAYQAGFEAGFDWSNKTLEDMDDRKNRPGFMDGYNAGVLCFSKLGDK